MSCRLDKTVSCTYGRVFGLLSCTFPELGNLLEGQRLAIDLLNVPADVWAVDHDALGQDIRHPHNEARMLAPQISVADSGSPLGVGRQRELLSLSARRGAAVAGQAERWHEWSISGKASSQVGTA